MSPVRAVPPVRLLDRYLQPRLLDRRVQGVPVLLAGELGQLGALVYGPERVADALLAVLALALVGRLLHLGLGNLDLLSELHVGELASHPCVRSPQAPGRGPCVPPRRAGANLRL